jgi:hypothetical protein
MLLAMFASFPGDVINTIGAAVSTVKDLVTELTWPAVSFALKVIECNPSPTVMLVLLGIDTMDPPSSRYQISSTPEGSLAATFKLTVLLPMAPIPGLLTVMTGPDVSGGT